jgi:hypothetical protein
MDYLGLYLEYRGLGHGKSAANIGNVDWILVHGGGTAEYFIMLNCITLS